MPVIMGMDPHERSATLEVLNEVGDVLTTGSSALTKSDMPKCWQPGGDSVTGCGRWKAVVASVGISLTGWSMTVRWR